MEIKQSPFAPKSYPELPDIDGISIFAGNAAIKYKNRPDVFLAVLDDNTSSAGVFTKSKTRSAAIDWCRATLKNGNAKALLVNSGNSNAFSGEEGIKAVEESMQAVANLIGTTAQSIYMCSTGVIGVPLPYQKITSKLDGIYKSGKCSWQDAALAISTTDTFLKMHSIKIGEITINGIAKGSGMIAPDMATMLAYIFTDAKISSDDLQQMLSEINEQTFNAITVDSDTSTSDSLIAFATNKKEVDKQKFRNGLEKVMMNLAHQVAKDGEGATKFIEVEVTGAENDKAAKKIALTIGNSPLVKTAIAGEDANWGRVVMAVGKSGEAAERDKLSIKFGELLVAEKGKAAPSYDEEKVSAYMKNQELKICVDVGVGNGKAIIWTCDLTHQYISINADYRS